MIKSHNIVRVTALGAAVPSLLLFARQPERMVKDRVQTRPVRDPYADILRASERLTAAQSATTGEQLKQEETA